jgi:small multidrug resistance family-3 protein
MDKVAVFGFLVIATSLEASGDAVMRMGLAPRAWPVRCLMFLAGTALLASYGLTLNLAPVEFGRVVGLYVAILFIVWQIVNSVAFRAVPDVPTLIGGSLVVAGGCIVAFWQR